MAIERVELLRPIEFGQKAEKYLAGLVVQAIANGRARTSALEEGFTKLSYAANDNGQREMLLAYTQDGRVRVHEIKEHPFYFCVQRVLFAMPPFPQYISILKYPHSNPAQVERIQTVLFDRDHSKIGDMLRRLEG